MGRTHAKNKIGAPRFKPYCPIARRPSIRNLEDFDIIREQFENLIMPSVSNVQTDNAEETSPTDSRKLATVNEKMNDLREAIQKILSDREKPLRLLKTFSNATMVSRQMLVGVQSKVALRTQVKELDVQLDYQHSEFLDVCGISVENLEDQNDPLRPSLIAAKFDESGDILDKVDEAFKKIKEKYPEKQEVIDFLDFIDKPVHDKINDGSSDSHKTDSFSSNKGEEYVKAKLPKVKTEIEAKFIAIKIQFESGTNITEYSLNQILRQLESLLGKLDDNSAFEKLLKEAYGFPDYDKVEIANYEKWQSAQKLLIEALVVSVNSEIEKVLKTKSESAASLSSKASYNTFLKKQDPPKFEGNCLDFMEFKRKWASQVSAHKPPQEYEMDLLKENIPVEGRKKLYGVDSLSSAWRQLEKMYGDKSLICQKLKSRLKNLKPVSSEPHETIIEINNEIEYLVKRLKDFNAVTLLYFDNEYLNVCYKHLPPIFQHEWDKFDTDGYEHDWMAFMEFMSSNAKSALKKRTLVESLKELSDDSKVKKGAKAIVAAVDTVQSDHSHRNNSVAELNDKQKEKYQELKKKSGNCKLCKTMHTFQSRWMKSPLPSDRFLNCPKFKAMTAKSRGETLEKFSSCARCLSWLHKKSSCKVLPVSCKEQVDGAVCGNDHSRLVCQSGVPYCTSLSVGTEAVGGSSISDVDENVATIPYLQDITVDFHGKRSTARSCWDNGSNRILVNNQFAEECGIIAKPATVMMKTAGGQIQKLDVNLYEFGLVERSGVIHRVWGYGVETILEPDDPIDPSCLRSLFPHVSADVFVQLEKRRLDLLIGINYNGLFPYGGTGRDCRENIRVMKTNFGPTGWILGGSHSKLKCSSLEFSAGAATLLTCARLHCSPDVLVRDTDSKLENAISVLKLSVDPMLTTQYWDKDNLSILPPRRCSKCQQCYQRGECSNKHLIHTLEEEDDLRAIEENIEIKNGVTLVKYPFKRDPSCLPYNRSTAVNIASKLWNSLCKDGLINAYNDEIKKYMDRGTFIVLSQQELSEYAGPVQYITHHGVLKDSTSTPLRVVTNSSFKNGKFSLNDLLPKGPNSLNDMLEVTLRFRAYEKVFAYDLAKAYNTMKTGIVERHLRRFIWRFAEDQPWQDFAIDCVHFGDRPAACQLEVSKKKIAQLGENIDQEASVKLIQDSYVDDGFSGGTEESIQRMVGNKDESGSYNGTISKILSLGGYKVKEFVVEGDMSQADENLLSNSVFGYFWDPKSKFMKMKISLNLSRKKRNVRVRPALSRADLNSLSDLKMTKRNLLGLTNSFGDFLGMADPFTIRFKLLMKNLFDKDFPLLWDDPVPDEEKQLWINLITEAVQSGEHIFPRSTRPEKAIGGPMIVGFGDGAFPAYGGCAYLVWEYSCLDLDLCVSSSCLGKEGGHFSSALALAKGRVTPLSGFTVPRSEMSGGVLVSRLVLRLARSLSLMEEKPKSAIILLDSECTISTLEAKASLLKPFFHNRRAEFLENMDVVSQLCTMEPVHWVGTLDNPADLLTRGTAKIDDIGLGSFWQVGPKFLLLPRKDWPVSREFVGKSERIPKEEMRTVNSYLRVAAVKISSDVPCISLFKTVDDLLSSNNCLESRKRVLARVINGWSAVSSGKSLESVRRSLVPSDLVKAEKLILLRGMVDTAIALEQGKLVSLMPYRSGNIIVTKGRLGEGVLERLLGVEELPILMANSRVAELYMIRAHRGHSGLLHRSVAETLARSRSSVWIVNGKSLAKKICSGCTECRRERKILLGQQMATLRPESSTICPPWTHIALDYAGPVLLKGEVNVRSRGKGWILVYICRSTKAVCLLPTAGYDTASFLVRHKEFIARKGRPRSIVSDRGTQLVKSGIVLAEKNGPKSWDWAAVVRANCASDWQFVPVGAAHRNGLAEATVKVLKQSLHHALAPGVVLSFSELNTLLAEIAFTVNSRPLGLRNVSGESSQADYLQPLTPNQLLLGRSNDDGPVLDFSSDDRFSRRLSYVTQVYNVWWDKWIRQVLPTLMPVKRWKKKQPNLSVNDVVMMIYPGNLKNDYRLAKVLRVHPDRNGLVRTVTVGYRKRDSREPRDVYRSKPLTEEEVSVQRLSLLVAAADRGCSEEERSE